MPASVGSTCQPTGCVQHSKALRMKELEWENLASKCWRDPPTAFYRCENENPNERNIGGGGKKNAWLRLGKGKLWM